MSKRKIELQKLCRGYLLRLRGMARRHGLESVVDGLIEANTRDECEATKKEVEALSRMCDDERVSRLDIPDILGKSYRQCCEDGDFDKLEKLRRVGIYSKVNTLLYKNKLDNKITKAK